MLERLAHRAPDGRSLWHASSVALGHGMLRTTRESFGERQPVSNDEDGLTLVADARIDNRTELIAALDCATPTQDALSDSALILAAYRKWGSECALKLVGDFAFAIWDDKARQLFCARDPIGVRSIFYYCDEHLFAFATEIKALFEIPGVPRAIDEERIADHLVGDCRNSTHTFFRGIRSLPAGHTLSLDAREPRIRRYWDWNPRREIKLASDGEYEEAFRAAFTEAVQCRLRSAFPIGSTLSGGLDSSSIVCVARQLLPTAPQPALHTFSAVFPGLPERDLRWIDERQYVAAVVAGGHLIPHEIRGDELDPLGNLKEVLWHLDDPGVPFNLYLHLAIYDGAREQGIRVVLDGVDGDTTVSHGYERLPELAKRLRFVTLLREARWVSRRAPGRSWTTRRVLAAHALQPLLPRSLEHLRSAALGVHNNAPRLLNKDFARRWCIQERANRLMKSQPSFKNARQSHLESFRSPIIPRVLELADKASGACSVEPRYPFFDRRLMELCLALPAGQKLAAGWGRSILRRAMQGILPPEVQWRPGKANLSPAFKRAMQRCARPMLESLLAAGSSSPAAGIFDFEALGKIRDISSDADAMEMFTGLTLMAWLGEITSSRP
jgi:asparagine synthase (glutamine-hydrolysing)